MSAAGPARRALALVDLTELGDSPSPDDIDRLCDRAVGPHGSTAAVCVWPRFATQAVQRLAGTGVAVATVVNFPAGGDDVEATVAETRRAVDDGVDEIDLVLPYRSFLAGRIDVAAAMVDAVRAEVTPPRRLKVILETGSYPSVESISAAARLAIAHGADFVKTSTGKTDVSATPAAVRAMLDAIRDSGRAVGIKPSGGIRTLDDAGVYLALADEVMGPQWATPATFRFGASGLLDALEAVIDGTEPHDADTTRY
jgi:deoxyribose-phosphate aldolase